MKGKRYIFPAVLIAVILVCSCALSGLLFLLRLERVTIRQEENVTRVTPVPQILPMKSIRADFSSNISYTKQPHHGAVSMTYSSSSSVSPIVRLSDAKVHSFGTQALGYQERSYSENGSRNVNSQSVVSGVMPITSFATLAAARLISTPASGDAPQMAQMASAPRRSPPPPPSVDNLVEQDQLIEHTPIGDSWVLLIIVIFYVGFVKNGKKFTKNLR